MGLKAPGILIFMLSLVLTLLVIAAKLGADIPLLAGHEFAALLAAQVILILGCTMRGL